MTTWAIGDIQGCWHSLRALLAKIDFRPGQDRLWLAGDLVNRGTGSLDVLRWAVRHREDIVAVMGNHEFGLLACAAGTRKPRKNDTIAAILNADDRVELLRWVRDLPLLHVEAGHVLVHAGLYPRWDLPTCIRRAADPDDFSLDTFTRMRLVRDDMSLDLGFTGPPSEAPPRAVPWFKLRVFEPGYTVLFGHWAALGLCTGQRWQSLDAGCVWGGQLAAYNLQSKEIITVASDPRDRTSKKLWHN